MTEEKPDTMELWNAVCTTDPANTKRADQRGGFTAICAQSQIMAATAQWGPMGGKWYVQWNILDNTHEALCVVEVILTYPLGDGEDGTIVHAGSVPWNGKYSVDQDALKKAITDGTTKCLSMLGFNADVFLGKFDDNKYVNERREEVKADAAKANSGGSDAKPDAPWTDTDKVDCTTLARIRAKELDADDAVIEARVILGSVFKDLGYGPDNVPTGKDVPQIKEKIQKYEAAA